MALTYSNYSIGSYIEAVVDIHKFIKTDAHNYYYQALVLYLLKGNAWYLPKTITLSSKTVLETGNYTFGLVFQTYNSVNVVKHISIKNSPFVKKMNNYLLAEVKPAIIHKLERQMKIEDFLYTALQEPQNLSDKLSETTKMKIHNIVLREYAFEKIVILCNNFHISSPVFRNIIKDLYSDDLHFHELQNDPYLLLKYRIPFKKVDYIASVSDIPANSILRYQGIIRGEFINQFLKRKAYYLTGDEIQEKLVNSKWLEKNSGYSIEQTNIPNSELMKQALSMMMQKLKIFVYSLKPFHSLEPMSYAEYQNRVRTNKLDPKTTIFVLNFYDDNVNRLGEKIGYYDETPKFQSLSEETVKNAAIAYSLTTGIRLDHQQIQALIHMFDPSPFTLINGEAGTGKSTLIKAFIWIYKNYIGKWNIELIKDRLSDIADKRELSTPYVVQLAIAAYTAKAASSYKTATQYKPDNSEKSLNYNFLASGTIHSLMGFSLDGYTDPKRAKFLISDYFIIDEASMLDAELLNRILNYLSHGTKLVFVGDTNQIPPIKAGQIFNDLIATKNYPTITLTNVYRQNKRSSIYQLAHEILKETKYNNLSLDESKTTMKEEINDSKVLEVIRQYITTHKAEQTLILTALHAGTLGDINLNKQIQAQLTNKKGNDVVSKNGTLFRDGDRVIQTQNDYTKDNNPLDNGMLGTIYIKKQEQTRDEAFKQKTIFVKFDDGTEVTIRNNTMLDNLALGYAITVHKSQGSEKQNCLVILDKSQKTMWNKNLLYTAVTRAKENLTLIGTDLKEMYNRATAINDTKTDPYIVNVLLNQIMMSGLPF